MKHHPPLKLSSILIVIFYSLTVLLVSSCGGAQAQENFTIGVVNYLPALDTLFESFKDEMAKRGYIEGKNVTYIYHGAAKPDSQIIDAEIKSLLTQDIDMLVTLGTLPTQRAMQAVEGTNIPIVFAPLINPVESGVVKDIRHPGGNVTGVQSVSSSPKALEWLLKITPKATKVYVFYNPEDQVSVISLKSLPEVAATYGVEFVPVEAHSLDEVTTVLKALPKDAVVFIIVTPSLPIANIISDAVKQGITIGSTGSGNLELGALMTYGISFTSVGQQVAHVVDQILQGSSPGDLPVESTEDFLGINLKTANTFGLNISDDILRQADTIIR